MLCGDKRRCFKNQTPFLVCRKQYGNLDIYGRPARNLTHYSKQPLETLSIAVNKLSSVLTGLGVDASGHVCGLNVSFPSVFAISTFYFLNVSNLKLEWSLSNRNCEKRLVNRFLAPEFSAKSVLQYHFQNREFRLKFWKRANNLKQTDSFDTIGTQIRKLTSSSPIF